MQSPNLRRLHENQPVSHILGTSRFWLRHASRLNVPGQVISILAGIAIAAYPRTSTGLRILAIHNVVCMLLNTIWYVRYWDTPAAIDAFLSDAEEHALSHSPLTPTAFMSIVATQYFLFSLLFAVSASVGTNSSIESSYTITASVWNLWCGATLAVAAALKYRNASAWAHPDERSRLITRTPAPVLPTTVAFTGKKPAGVDCEVPLSQTFRVPRF